MFRKSNTHFGSKQTLHEDFSKSFSFLKKKFINRQILNIWFSPNICRIPNQGRAQVFLLDSSIVEPVCVGHKDLVLASCTPPPLLFSSSPFPAKLYN